MKNLIDKEGCSVIYTCVSGDDIAPGDVVIKGQFVGVSFSRGAYRTSTDFDKVVVELEGVYELKKDSPLAIAQGDKLYWNTTDKEITKTNTDVYIGIAFVDAGSTDTTAQVKLDRAATAPQAADIDFTAGANLTAVPGSFADVAAVRTYLLTLVSEIETRLDANDAGHTATLAALKTAGLMAG